MIATSRKESELSGVLTKSANVTPYHGSSRLTATIPTPIAARRSWAPSERRRSVKRLPAPVAVLDVVPPVDRVLAQLPAEIDLLAVADRREVDQPAVDVAHDDAGLLERAEQPAHLEERLADLAPLLTAAVCRRRLGLHLVRLLIGQQVLGVAQPLEHGLDAREHPLGLVAAVVAVVDHAVSGTAVRAAPAAASMCERSS